MSLLQGQPQRQKRHYRSLQTPLEIVGIVVLVGIMLFATVTATNVLGFEALTVIVSGLILILGRILAGLVVFMVGLYLANLATEYL